MTVETQIQTLLKAHPVVLFMKGSEDFPQCGFSAQAVAMLHDCGVTDINVVDVLQDPVMRQGIKDFSDWPTVPQLYVKGQFIGGCDIMTDLHQSGELHKILA